MIKVNVSRFPLSFNHLNQSNVDLKISRYDIARAYMTIGFPKLTNAIQLFGVKRFIELVFRSFNYITLSKGYFKLNDLYKSLDPSEQRTITYFLGQSLAKLFAEKKLKCIIVDHINNHKTYINFATTTASFVPKIVLHTTKKIAKEPDLIGLDSSSDYHVLEAKGYSSGFNGGEFQHAINQVSRVNTVNSKSPATKSACFFDLSNSPFLGTIVDPDSSDKELSITFSENTFINQYYSIFNFKLLRRKLFWIIKIGGFEFALFRIFPPFRPFIYYGVEYSIFEKVNTNKQITLNDIPNFSDAKISLEEDLNYSIGPDGTIFLEIKNTLRKKFLEKKIWK